MSNPSILLHEVAEIRVGYTFREKVEEVSLQKGNARIAQIKDVRAALEEKDTAFLEASSLPLIDWEGKKSAFIEPGSILLPARGAKGGFFRASCLVSNEENPLPVIASSHFLVITSKCEQVLPEFLCWSLNQPAIQYFLAEGAGSQGSSIGMLTVKEISMLMLDIPSLKAQQKILHLNQLWEQERRLTQALLKNREKMVQGLFLEMLKEKK